MEKKYVCDTSIIVDGRVLEFIETKNRPTIVLDRLTIYELEHQANLRKEIGFAGLDVIKKLREKEEEGKLILEILGGNDFGDYLRYGKLGSIDSKIRELAKELDAVLITGDRVQHTVANAEGIESIYLEPKESADKSIFEKYFTKDTMSVHIKEDCRPVRKRGNPGNMRLEEIGDEVSTGQIEVLSEQIVELAKKDKKAYFEIDKYGATVIQLREYRIVMTKPPFSEKFEITIVRPIKKTKLEDYKLSEKLLKRINQESEGILISGPPGSGKSTFAAALADYYANKGYVIKTMENPRDMRVNKRITQYTALEGSFEDTKDILLLVRPDYSFYDEMRKSKDFEIFSDMRMAGIGMVGVVHGRKAIDAIQRFIGKVELGVIPHVIDTVILIDGGKVSKVYSLRHTVKVPSGMREQDLARPVIEIKDFETDELEYEIYKFGEETVVLPISETNRNQKKYPLEIKLGKILKREFRVIKKRKGFRLELHPEDLEYISGKKGRKQFKALENRFGPFEVDTL